ncbi:helix-turn-helix domain-containing protein [Natrialba sp. PRR66]|uniref:MarR family transcriptional regulator n=1 Tax=Natrialba sp. PRR66 TaxID=3098146 RepID=UPI002B1DF7DE|nr:helix-turn-helix domain-containing protein [Natrialba sp. PRR66]
MPVPVDKLTNDEPFPVKPDTNEYEALRFLVANQEYGFTPLEVSDQTNISKSSASKTMARLFKKDLAKRSNGAYYVEPEHVNKLQQRLESLDAAVQLFESTPDDDAYAEEGWEEDLPSINPDDEPTTVETRDSTTVEAEAEHLITDLEDN